MPAAPHTLACVHEHVVHRVRDSLRPLGTVAQRRRPRLLTCEAGLRSRLLEQQLGRVLQPQPGVGFRQHAKPHTKPLATLAALGPPASWRHLVARRWRHEAGRLHPVAGRGVRRLAAVGVARRVLVAL